MPCRELRGMETLKHSWYVCNSNGGFCLSNQITRQFSDEFNTDGRTFYDGDDPYFQGVDIWYGATQDLEVTNHFSSIE